METAPPKAAAAPKQVTPKPAAATPKSTKPEAATPKSTKPTAATPKSSAAATPDSNSWSKDEDGKLQKALAKFSAEVDNRWEKIAKEVGTRSKEQCKKRVKSLKSSPS